MGYSMWTKSAAGQHVGFKIGSYGCQPYLTGLFFAAYAADQRPEANRVTAWVAPTAAGRSWGEPLHPDAPWTKRNHPATAQALLDFNDGQDEGSTYTYAQCDTIELGCKFKQPADPDLVALVEFHNAVNAPELPHRITADLARRVAPVLRGLLPRIEANEWYSTCVEVAEVLEAAAAANSEVSCG